MCRIECGHPGIFPVDVVSMCFQDVVKVVQKLESSRARRTQLQVLPKSAEIHDMCIRPRGVFVVAQSVQPQLAAQQSEKQPEGWRFVPDTILPGYQWAPQWVPARDTHGTLGPISGKAVGGP